MKKPEPLNIRRLLKTGRAKTLNSLGSVLQIPTANWVLLSFFVVFFAYYFVPIFLNSYHELHFFPNFPEVKPLGADLREYLGFSKALVETGTPYIIPNYYPPFQAVFFLRFMYSGPDQSFVFMTVLSFLSFLAITWLYPLLVAKQRQLNSIAVFALVTGLFSYGLLFQLERGQFDLLVMAMCYAGIYLYHRHPRLRLAAYLLFILSVNIKIYPVVFILCFTSEWRDWKRNLIRWGLLMLANFAGLFILGWKVFLDFVHALTTQLNAPTYWWSGNHSIDSFVRVIIQRLENHPILYNALQPNFRWLTLGLLLIYLICLGAVLYKIFRERLSAANPYLILLLTLGSMLVPSTSHDYKLSILIAPIVLLFNTLDLCPSGKTYLDLAATLLLVTLSTAYSSTLFIHHDLPLLLTNNMPALLIIAISSAMLFWVRSAQAHQKQSRAEYSDLS